MRRVIFSLTLGFVGLQARAADLIKQIPDEYETTSVLGTALNNAAYAGSDPHAAVRANPALLSLEKTYSIYGGYHWPTAGREYFQAGVVDSKTSPVAAGVSYTGYADDYLYPNDPAAPKSVRFDSPIIRRGVIGLAQVLGAVSLGAGATYVEANSLVSSEEKQQGEDRIRGFGLNAGAAGVIAPGLRVGVSGENLSNKRIKDYAPSTYRGGFAYMFGPLLTAYLDYRHRERVVEFEGPRLRLDAFEDEGYSAPEQMVLASATANLQDSIRFLGSYGHAISADRRRSLSGGIAIINKTISLSYTVNRPYLARSDTHQAIALAIDMSM